MSPSTTPIQFEHATLSTPGQDRRQRTVSTGTNTTKGTMTSKDAVRTDSGTGFASSNAAAAPSSTHKMDKRTVVTVPAWAHPEPSSPPPTPTLSSSQLSKVTSTQGSLYAQTRSPTRTANGWQSPRTAHQHTKSATQKEEEAAISAGTSGVAHDQGHARFFTFTLPIKYRNRLHDHPFKRTRSDAEQQNSQAGGSGTAGTSKEVQQVAAASSSHRHRRDTDSDSSSSVSDGEDILPGATQAQTSPALGHDRGDEKLKRRIEALKRRSTEGLGSVHASAEAAAGLGGQDSLVSWRRRQQGVAQTPMESSPDDSSYGMPEPLSRTGRVPSHRDAEAGGGRGRKGGRGDTRAAADDDEQRPPVTQEEEQGDEGPSGIYRPKHIRLPTHAERSFTRRQDSIPGWESPWRPEEMHGLGAIDVGGYTFTGGDEFYPRTNTRRTVGGTKKNYSTASMMALRKGRRARSNGGNGNAAVSTSGRNVPSSEALKEKQGQGPRQTWIRDKWERWQEFLMRNPFVPLLFRAINFSFTTATLAIAIRLFIILHQEGAADSVGASPVVAIIVAPLSLVHVATQVWLEYFSRPIGLWAVKSKLSYQLIELVFISLWSAELALTFDNYATSSLTCVSWYSVSAGGEFGADGILSDPSLQPLICRHQAVLIALTFVTLIAYTAVFSVSLFRTVVR